MRISTRSSGREGWLILAVGGSWFTAVCVAWASVELSLGVLARDVGTLMFAAFILQLVWLAALVVIALNLVLASKHTGLPPWARISAFAVAAFTALISVAPVVLWALW